jgi:hypothetical protein
MKGNPSELKQILDVFHELADKPGKRQPVLVVGEMGIGKSQIVMQWGKDKGYDFIFDFRGATQSPEDMTGMPRAVDMKTSWLAPDWIPSDKSKKMLLIFEELNRAPVDVQQAIFQALTENKIHTHVFPDHTMIVSCINPENSIYHVSALDPAMHTRFFRFELEPDVDEWLQYMHENTAEDRVIQFIGVHRDLLCQPAESGACPTPRSWKKLSDALQIGAVNDDMLFNLAVGFIGKEGGVAFRTFCDKAYKKPVTGKELLSEYDKVKKRLEEQRNDEMSVTVSDLCALLGSGKARLQKKQFDNLKDFLLTCKAEWKVNIIQKLPSSMLTELSTVPELIDAVADILQQTNKSK